MIKKNGMSGCREDILADRVVFGGGAEELIEIELFREVVEALGDGLACLRVKGEVASASVVLPCPVRRCLGHDEVQTIPRKLHGWGRDSDGRR